MRKLKRNAIVSIAIVALLPTISAAADPPGSLFGGSAGVQGDRFGLPGSPGQIVVKKTSTVTNDKKKSKKKKKLKLVVPKKKSPVETNPLYFGQNSPKSEPLENLSDDSEFLKKIVALRREIVLASLQRTKKKLTEPSWEASGQFPGQVPGMMPGQTPGMMPGPMSNQQASLPPPPEHPKNDDEDNGPKIVGWIGDQKVIIKFGRRSFIAKVGDTIDGLKVVKDKNGDISLEDTTSPISKGGHGPGSQSSYAVPGGGPAGSGQPELKDVRLESTSHFNARLVYRGEEREVQIGSQVGHYNVVSIGNNNIVLRNMVNMKDYTIEVQPTDVSVPEAMAPVQGFQGFVPPPPPPQSPYQGQGGQNAGNDDNY